MNDCNVTKEELESFLRSVDKDFPVPLSGKTDLSLLAEKLVEKADIFAKRVEDEVAGVAIGYVTNSFSEISFLSIVAVKKKYRGLGVAKKVLANYLQAVQGAGRFYAADVYTKEENKIAVQMYKSMGFVEYQIENEPRPNDLHLIYYIEEN